MPDETDDKPGQLQQAPTLDYRPPREEERGPGAMDILRGALATIICIVCLGPGILFIVGALQSHWDEPWKPYVCLLCGLLALSGSLAAVRSARFYFAGRRSSAYNFKLWGYFPHRRR